MQQLVHTNLKQMARTPTSEDVDSTMQTNTNPIQPMACIQRTPVCHRQIGMIIGAQPLTLRHWIRKQRGKLKLQLQLQQKLQKLPIIKD